MTKPCDQFAAYADAYLDSAERLCQILARSKIMGNVKSIEKAIEALLPAELIEFRCWLAEFDAAAWDRQVEHDAAAGRLDELTAETLTDFRSGTAREL